MKKSRKELVNTRWTIRRDFPSIVAINNQSLPEITEDDLIKIYHNTQKPVSLVAEIKEIVVGYVIYFVRSNRYEISHIAVHQDYRQKGIGSVLLNNIKMKLVPSQEKGPTKDIYNYSMQSTSRSRISITVPDHLLHAHLFLRANGFRGQITNNDSYRFEYKI